MNINILSAALQCPVSRAKAFKPWLTYTAETFGISETIDRHAMFLAQLGHESEGLLYMAELWGPTPAQRRYERDMSAPWPTSVAVMHDPKYARNQLAFKLGNTETGDGRKFAGHGPIQVTGRTNHKETTVNMRARFPDMEVPDFEVEPNALTEIHWGCLAAGLFWESRDLNALIDANAGDTEKQLQVATLKINGGYNGIVKRRERWLRCLELLNSPAAQEPDEEDSVDGN